MFCCSLLRYEDNNTDPVLAKVNCRFSGNSDYGEDHILRCSSSAEIEDIQCEVGDEVFIECGEKIEELLPHVWICSKEQSNCSLCRIFM